MKKSALLLLTASFLTIMVNGQDTIRFQSLSYNDLLQQVESTGKPALLYFTGTGCTLCKVMEKNVFTDPEVSELYNNRFVNVELFDDFYKPDSAIRQLRAQYDVVSNPTFIFINASGQVLHKTRYNEKEGFIKVAQQALGHDNYASWKKQVASGTADPDILIKYLEAETPARMYVGEDFVCPSQTALDTYFAGITEDRLTDSMNWQIINRFVFDPRSKVFQYLLNHQEAYKKFGQLNVDKKIYDVFSLYISGNRGSARFQRAERELQQMTYPQAKILLQFHRLVHLSGRILETADSCRWFINQADDLVRQHYTLINDYQVMLWVESMLKQVTDPVYLAKTNQWMERIVSLPENQDYYYYIVYARNLHLLHQKNNAVAIQQKAIELAVQDKADADELSAMKAQLEQYRGS